MSYVSTRGAAPPVAFREALIAGLAEDGGLYMPDCWPRLAPGALAEIDGLSFADAASLVLAPYTEPWLDRASLAPLCRKAYSGFAHPQVAPLVRLGPDEYLLELFHGPTLAFKDVAMQLLGLMFERALAETGATATIIAATSGDTGGAAIEAFRGRAGVDIVVLHPKGRISEVQRRFMTTRADANISNIAVEGSFDDCQRIVKAIFADRAFSRRHCVSGVNSINWARLAIQTVYYFTAASALRRTGEGRAPTFCVPTGNFGDVFAGYGAKEMGLAMRGLLVAVNDNDIMHRALATGDYAPRGAVATISPSMDIEVASNFERLLYEASGRDGTAIRSLMNDFARDGRFAIPEPWLAAIQRDFASGRTDEAHCRATIADVHQKHAMLIDPHTAVGLSAARRSGVAGPVITLATAHAAKFPDAVEAATGERPALPGHVADLFAEPERFVTAPADIGAVKAIIESGRRA